MARGEIHVELAVDYADDPKLRALSRYGKDARSCRDLYVQMTCYAKRTKSDGFVPDEQLGLLVYPDAPKNGKRDADRLVTVGVCDAVEGGYNVRAFLKRNKSRQQIEGEEQAAGAEGQIGAHERWHIGRGIVKESCPLCVGHSPPHSPPHEVTDGVEQCDAMPKSESESESESGTHAASHAPSARKRAHRLPPDFSISDEMGNFALGLGLPESRIRHEHGKFVDHFLGAGTSKLDWTRTWQVWMRRASEQGGSVRALPGATPPRNETVEERAKRRGIPEAWA